MSRNGYLKNLYNFILSGKLKESLQIIFEHGEEINNTFPIFFCLIRMKSRTYKLYKQIMLIKAILKCCPKALKYQRFLCYLALKYNCTYLVKILLRYGINANQFLPLLKIKPNMQKLINNYNFWRGKY